MPLHHTGPRLLGGILLSPDDPPGLPGIPGAGPSGQPPLPTSQPLWGPGSEGSAAQPAAAVQPAGRADQPPAPGQLGPPSTFGTPPAGPGPVVQRPEQLAGTFVLSGWWRRVGAQLIDWFIAGFLVVIPLSVGVMASGVTSSSDGTTTAGFALTGVLAVLAMFALLALAVFYAPLWMSRTNGSTIGKKLCGIRVVRADGQRVDFGYACLREIVVKDIVFGMVGAWFFLPWLLNYLWPLWDSEHRAGHDYMVKSRVVLDD